MDTILNRTNSITLSQAKNVLGGLIQHNIDLKERGIKPSKLIVPYLIGEPGVGKTSIVEQIAAEQGIELITLIIAQYDQADLGGLPCLYDDPENNTKIYIKARPEYLPTEGRGILFCDEITQAYMANMNIVSQLTNEGRIGNHKLPKGWVTVLASNDASNRAGTNPMPTHLKDRLAHFWVKPNPEDTVSYFHSAGVNTQVIAYLKVRPDMLHVFKADDDVCPSPRSWEKVGTILDNPYLDGYARMRSMMATVGEAAARDFRAFEMCWDKMPDPDEVIKSPKDAPIPEEADIRYILATAIAAKTTEDNAKNVIAYTERLAEVGEEFSHYLVSSVIERTGGRKSPMIKRNKAFKDYIWIHCRNLFDYLDEPSEEG